MSGAMSGAEQVLVAVAYLQPGLRSGMLSLGYRLGSGRITTLEDVTDKARMEVILDSGTSLLSSTA